MSSSRPDGNPRRPAGVIERIAATIEPGLDAKEPQLGGRKGTRFSVAPLLCLPSLLMVQQLPVIVRLHNRTRSRAVQPRQRLGIAPQVGVPERRGQRKNHAMVIRVARLEM